MAEERVNLDPHGLGPPSIEEVGEPITLATFAEAPVQEAGAVLQFRQEWVRGLLAIGFGVLFAAVVLLPLLVLDTWIDIKEWLQAALPAVTGLLGAVMGFYFGQRSNT